MTWKAHPKFMAGHYRSVVEELLDSKNAPAKARKEHIVSLIGSLSFLGRMEEAGDLFDLVVSKSKNPLFLTASRFFLAVGWTRRSEYERAKKLFEQNEKEAGDSPHQKFFVHQGKVFYLFYTGRLDSCLAEAEAARKWAIASRDLFARCLATDAIGSVLVGHGDIHLGITRLKEAREFARKIGNHSLSSAIDISILLYECEYGLHGDSVARLEKALDAKGTEDSFSQANISLELARQYTLRGRFADAAKALEAAAENIYANQNRRQEIRLNLRLAELAGRRGEFFQARHFLWFSRRLLHREVDSSFELAALGIERKLALAEGKSTEALALEKKWKALSEFYSTRDRNLRNRLGLQPSGRENPEDRVHVILSQAALAPTVEKRLTPLLEAGYLSEASLALRLPPARKAVALLPKNMGLLIQAPEKIEWKEEALSSLQAKLLRALAEGKELSKEALVQKIWGYNYAPLRHDSMVYAALSGLRKALGPAGAWLQPTENGYRLDAFVTVSTEKAEEVSQAAPALQLVPDEQLSRLNHRQIEIMEWIRTVRFVSVADCRKRFGTSEITALRDMDGLRKEGFVVRTGKARATRYSLAKGE